MLFNWKVLLILGSEVFLKGFSFNLCFEQQQVFIGEDEGVQRCRTLFGCKCALGNLISRSLCFLWSHQIFFFFAEKCFFSSSFISSGLCCFSQCGQMSPGHHKANKWDRRCGERGLRCDEEGPGGVSVYYLFSPGCVFFLSFRVCCFVALSRSWGVSGVSVHPALCRTARACLQLYCRHGWDSHGAYTYTCKHIMGEKKHSTHRAINKVAKATASPATVFEHLHINVYTTKKTGKWTQIFVQQ